MININVDINALTIAINTFNKGYHEDYFEVREFAKSYLAEPAPVSSAKNLAERLLKVLRKWGAEKRRAPKCKEINEASQALCNPLLHKLLKDLAISFPFLDVLEGGRVLKEGAPFSKVEEFDQGLLDALNMLADGLMSGNTNVTYPMKALLLITGLAPAYDSQVRAGLDTAKFTGIDKTRYVLPRHDCADARKITVLPFYIAHCVTSNLSLLDAAIERSKYHGLKGEYGRLFDVLLFVQGRSKSQCPLVEFKPPLEFR